MVERSFFERLLSFCKERELLIIHDFAYADLCYDGYQPPSILSIPGAREIAVESYSLSKGFSLAGWRLGFFLGNRELIAALKRIKSYLDFGAFQPLQISVAHMLEREPEVLEDFLEETGSLYRSRLDVLAKSLTDAGWQCAPSRATLFLWARLPESLRDAGSIEAAKLLLRNRVAVCPGEGFHPGSREWVRFAVTEPERRIRIAAEALDDLSSGKNQSDIGASSVAAEDSAFLSHPH